MKKVLLFLITVSLVVFGVSACGNDKQIKDEKKSIQIVTTIFPEYDWVMNILGENPANIEVIMLLDKGVDLHSYQPTADDILKISTCDMFIYVGGESDEWVEDALKEATNKNMQVINLLDLLGDSVKEEELVPGMQEDDEGEGEVEYDEHVWLSLKNASMLVKSISENIKELDSQNRELYEHNTILYLEKLDSLDKEYYQAVTTDAGTDTLLFADRFPFRYLTDDYGLSYYAAFAGCSAETEASFETITFLSQKADELGLDSVITIEGSDKRIAETIIENTLSKNQQILTLDSMQSATYEDVKNGNSYLSIMEKNLSTLKKALE